MERSMLLGRSAEHSVLIVRQQDKMPRRSEISFSHGADYQLSVCESLCHACFPKRNFLRSQSEDYKRETPWRLPQDNRLTGKIELFNQRSVLLNNLLRILSAIFVR
jgi:hypothetical protein